ncbi:MAG: hypothetical protein R6X07_03605, partial [Desulfatiglandales bacterium]
SNRVILIKDSFGLPVYSFLAPAIKETRALDMRYFDENVVEYAKGNNPDVVIIMYNADSFNDEMFNFKLPRRHRAQGRCRSYGKGDDRLLQKAHCLLQGPQVCRVCRRSAEESPGKDSEKSRPLQVPGTDTSAMKGVVETWKR